PVIDITSVTAVDSEENGTAVSSALYHLDATRETLVFSASVISHRVEIVYQAGFGAAASVPKPIKAGLLAHIAALYDNRGEAEAAMPLQAARLYAPYRALGV